MISTSSGWRFVVSARTVERKFGDGEFVKYDSVSSNVNTFSDAVEDFGNYVYRIYAVNPTQKTGYSNTAGILITRLESGAQNTTSPYPNPATNTMTLRVKDPKERIRAPSSPFEAAAA